VRVGMGMKSGLGWSLEEDGMNGLGSHKLVKWIGCRIHFDLDLDLYRSRSFPTYLSDLGWIS